MLAKLSAELFNEIVANLKSDTATSRIHEKRAEGRVGLRSKLDLILFAFADTGEERATVWVRDVSIKGLGIVCSIRMAEGLEFIAQFTRDDQSPVSVLYKVHYCRRIARGLFSVGAKFERVMADTSGERFSICKGARPAKIGIA